MKLGILGTADIAFRRFLPALKKCPGITYGGVASRTPQKGEKFREQFGGVIYPSYDALLEDPEIQAVYVPLPPALHYEWGRKVLLAGKHLLMEKPFTVSPEETRELIALAESKGLAIHENYMFLYHSQLQTIRSMAAEGAIGELRLIRASFGFPFRGTADFRYDKTLGGGALLDCGGYPLRLASLLLGDSARVVSARLNTGRDLEVDLYGSAQLENDLGQTAQIAFGMDSSYQCRLELWGSQGLLTAPRIFTAPAGLPITLELQTQAGTETIHLPQDDSFLHSIEKFTALIRDPALRETHGGEILRQSILTAQLRGEK